ncbi:MAG: branched-chain alpha-keto acid dehydrogenase subunit E2 [Pedosphaera sp.]|nr:branched-chain alpha-keto acid dehydrogenase subunit E2 [Pedosphaera sp.]
MDVKLPNLGEGADSGTIVSILVKEGEEITQGQNLIELENGKAVVAVPSPVGGKVGNVLVKVGDKISVGNVIVVLEGAVGTASKLSEPSVAPVKASRVPGIERTEQVAAGEAEQKSLAEPALKDSPFPPPASPTVRKIARDLGIDLRRIKGSEHGGRIVLDDVRSYIDRLQKLGSTSTKASAKPAETSVAAVVSIDFSKWGTVTRQPMTSLRKTISRRMVESWTTIPHVTQFDEADISGLMELRKKHKAAYEAAGASLTVTVFVLRALLDTLKQHPIFNASIDESKNEVVLKDYFHFGIAVDTEAGLIVPVIRDVDKKSMAQLARELSNIAVKTRDRKVGLEDLVGGSFTISNQGGIGGAHFTPIVNKPEVAILGLGRGVLKAAVKNGKIEPATMLPLCLSYDHRLIDGGSAARFIKDLLTALENFNEENLKL